MTDEARSDLASEIDVPDREGSVNAAQSAAWNGREGEHWADHHVRYDAVNEGFDAPLLAVADIASTDRVLDVGCGTGQLTRAAAARAPRGRAVGVDLSAPMLERAVHLAAAAGAINVLHVLGDAQVHPFPVASYDVIVSRFGVMFFDDLVAAFANLGGALRSGGRLAFVSMRPLIDHDLHRVLEALSAHLPHPDDESTGHGPFSLSEPSVVREVLGSAGFDDVEVAAVDATQVWGRDAADAAAFFAGWGPVRHALAELDADGSARAVDATHGAFRAFEEAGAVRLRGAGWLVSARWP